MRILICSSPDRASVNIRDNLLSLFKWSEIDKFEGYPIFVRGDNMLVTISQLHLYANCIDQKIAEAIDSDITEIIFLSRHKAASGIHTLTVHPIGNFSVAEYGGFDKELVPSAHHSMTEILRRLKKFAKELPFGVSFEVTHHGPYLDKPTLFVEIGSDESMWENKKAAIAIAKSIMELQIPVNPVLIGIGGGHYAPRFTEVALTKKVSFGHMIPNYAIENTGEEEMMEIIEMAYKRTPGAQFAYLHKKSMKRSIVTRLTHLLNKLNIETIESESLEEL
ncbi:MAG: D-aminoacyl-tRNA deacylase [Methanomassiliicoccales archaeon]|jgi:D-aminoacyl-tRNA deacylase|nr:D-aminoacyl-tRNA deacylase [Methanomassiliicoccales archaeon]